MKVDGCGGIGAKMFSPHFVPLFSYPYLCSRLPATRGIIERLGRKKRLGRAYDLCLHSSVGLPWSGGTLVVMSSKAQQGTRRPCDGVTL